MSDNDWEEVTIKRKSEQKGSDLEWEETYRRKFLSPEEVQERLKRLRKGKRFGGGYK